jgi:DNA-binding transcriptional LysR family regulator
VLNQAGEQLLVQIQEPLAQLEQAASAIKDLGKWGHGRLRVGAPASLAEHLVPEVAKQLHRAFPNLVFVLECAETERLLDMVRQRQLDVALVLDPEEPAGLEVKPLFKDELLFAIWPEHPWAEGRPLSGNDMSQEPLISYRRGGVTALLMRQFFSRQGIEPRIIMEVGSASAMRELVKRGIAIAPLAPWLFDHELRHGLIKMRALGPKPLRRRWTIVHAASGRPGWAEEEFFKHCRRQVTRMRLDRKDLPLPARVLAQPVGL